MKPLASAAAALISTVDGKVCAASRGANRNNVARIATQCGTFGAALQVPFFRSQGTVGAVFGHGRRPFCYSRRYISAFCQHV